MNWRKTKCATTIFGWRPKWGSRFLKANTFCNMRWPKQQMSNLDQWNRKQSVTHTVYRLMSHFEVKQFRKHFDCLNSDGSASGQIVKWNKTHAHTRTQISELLICNDIVNIWLIVCVHACFSATCFLINKMKRTYELWLQHNVTDFFQT